MKIERIEKKEVEVNVEFPIYRQQDVSGDMYECIVYTKILNESKQIKITRYRGFYNNWDIEVSTPIFRNASEDYLLGKGIYSLSEEEFNSVVDEFKEFVRENFAHEQSHLSELYGI